MLMLLKDLNIKTLNTGDKSGRLVLVTLDPKDIGELKQLAEEREVDIYFKLLDNGENKN